MSAPSLHILHPHWTILNCQSVNFDWLLMGAQIRNLLIYACFSQPGLFVLSTDAFFFPSISSIYFLSFSHLFVSICQIWTWFRFTLALLTLKRLLYPVSYRKILISMRGYLVYFGMIAKRQLITAWFEFWNHLVVQFKLHGHVMFRKSNFKIWDLNSWMNSHPDIYS